MEARKLEGQTEEYQKLISKWNAAAETAEAMWANDRRVVLMRALLGEIHARIHGEQSAEEIAAATPETVQMAEEEATKAAEEIRILTAAVEREEQHAAELEGLLEKARRTAALEKMLATGNCAVCLG